MATQFQDGDQGVQIGHAEGSTFVITYNNGVERAVPLERASVPVPPGTSSPARLIRARSGVFPFVARQGLLDEVIRWLRSEVPFSGMVIGGAGGSGKTRLAVELCEWAEKAEWLNGLLTEIEDQASLETLAEAPFPRLVVVDYAESRAAQLKALLPLLASRATLDFPVRVLLLVRAGPRRTNDWTESLRNQSDILDNVLDQCQTHVLEDLPLEAEERSKLFEAAAAAFARHLGTDAAPAPPGLGSPDFASPLLVILAAYLATQGDPAPDTREELLRGVLAHEERHWRSSSGDLFDDPDQPRRVIALATLLGARTEAEAVARLRLLPDYRDASAERLGLLARWVRRQYPGIGWWNPLEPDLIGEQLVADEFSDRPGVLGAVLAGDDPSDLLRPLEVLGRAAADHPRLNAEVRPILADELVRLCAVAVAQSQGAVDEDLLYGRTVTVAAVLEKVVATVELDRDSLVSALELMPDHFDLVLNSLALILNLRLVEHARRLVVADPIAYQPDLGMALNNLSNCLSEAGRREEALAPMEEASEVFRRLASADSAAHELNLSKALNNLSSRLGELGRHEEALVPIEETVEIRRRLAAADPAAHDGYLAGSLNNLSNRLGELGRHEEAVVPIEEALEIRRRLAAANPSVHEPDLAGSLNNLSIRFAVAGRREDALDAVEEAVAVYGRLAASRPAAFEPDLAMALTNLSNRLAESGRGEDALEAIHQAVAVYRRLAAAKPAAFEVNLVGSLANLSICLLELGLNDKALARVEEAMGLYERLGDPEQLAVRPFLAGALKRLEPKEGLDPEP